MNELQRIIATDLRLRLESESYTPYYQQIVTQIRELAKSEKIREGQTFCSEAELAHALGVSKMPVRHAFHKLQSEGLLVIKKGKRPVVGSRRLPWNFQQLRGFSEEMRRRGLKPTARLLKCDLIKAAGDVAAALGLHHNEPVYRIKRLRLVDGDAVAIVTSYLPARLFPDMDRQDLEGTSFYVIYERVYKRRLDRAEEVIGAVSAEEEDARVLETTAGAALLLIRETTFDSSNVAIEHSVSLLRGDRYTASVISVRRHDR